MGMIPGAAIADETNTACPHTHGDDPLHESRSTQDTQLVPTRMGMILPSVDAVYSERTCPHTHGDDPGKIVLEAHKGNVSPHAWG